MKIMGLYRKNVIFVVLLLTTVYRDEFVVCVCVKMFMCKICFVDSRYFDETNGASQLIPVWYLDMELTLEFRAICYKERLEFSFKIRQKPVYN